MKKIKNEKRFIQLIEDPNNDTLLEEDIPLIRSGLLYLNWTDRSEGRVHPFVTAAPQAVKYFQKEGRLTPAHLRTLKEIASVSKKDIEWAKHHIQPNYGNAN